MHDQRFQRFAWAIVMTLAVLTLPLQSSAADQVYAPPSASTLKFALNEWMQTRELLNSPAPELLESLDDPQQVLTAGELFDLAMRLFYLTDDEVRQLVDDCGEWTFSPTVLKLELPDLSRRAEEPLLVDNTRYFLARYLTLLGAYDEALEVFQEIELRNVIDPAGCFFHRAVCEHHLLQKQEGLASLELLLKQTEKVPVRYRTLGELMAQDLKGVQEKSLGEVARQMRDVERRLSLGQTGERTQQVEDQIIATLDELIKRLEDQQQSSSSMAGVSPMNQSSGGSQSGNMGPAPHEVEPTPNAPRDHWGDLPPKERDAAKNMLENQFPAHYRQAVEEYLKKLADRPASQK